MQPNARLAHSLRNHGKMRSLALGLGALAAGALVVFHALILVERIRDLSILQPSVALQWIGTLLLVTLLGYLRWQRGSIVKGRSALTFWLLVLLLHLIPGASASPVTERSPELLLTLPTSWLAATTSWLAAVVTALLIGRVVRSGDAALRARRQRRGTAALEAGFASVLAARPPPPILLH